MSSQPAPAAKGHAAPGLAYNMAGITVLLLLLAVGAAYLIDELGRQTRAPVPALTDGNPITQTIAGRELAIPTSWFRYGEQLRDGFTNQIDLQVMLTASDGAALPVNVTLLPRSRVRTSASLLDRVYVHQFTGATLGGVAGLVGKPMRNENGYAGESVWYDALSPNPFVAKCLAAADGAGSEQCVRTVYLPSGMAVVYAFDATALQSWRQFDGEMAQWLSRIGAN
ncbi:hypothetical protein [Devosia sp.]|uniref:hypothetical protein n=1 Tax=Devosia sp. TaxID=1871048 RepID=UPI00273763A9|nr:hypothetical protein [Devosia sp.]MDP2780975.1 hypothetical protein [Devosia sp.]